METNEYKCMGIVNTCLTSCLIQYHEWKEHRPDPILKKAIAFKKINGEWIDPKLEEDYFTEEDIKGFRDYAKYSLEQMMEFSSMFYHICDSLRETKYIPNKLKQFLVVVRDYANTPMKEHPLPTHNWVFIQEWTKTFIENVNDCLPGFDWDRISVIKAEETSTETPTKEQITTKGKNEFDQERAELFKREHEDEIKKAIKKGLITQDLECRKNTKKVELIRWVRPLIYRYGRYHWKDIDRIFKYNGRYLTSKDLKRASSKEEQQKNGKE